MANPGNVAAQALVQSLKAGGLSYSEIARRVGRDSSLISQIARKGNKGASLVGALQQIQSGAKTVAVPRRTSQAGTAAKVRRGIEKIPGGDNIAYTTQKGDKTMTKALQQGKDKPVKWKIKMKTLKTTSDRIVHNTGVNGGSSFRRPWTCDKLLDRIQNPQPGDNWQPGEARKAMAEIAIMDNSNAFTSYSGIQEVQMYTI